MEYMSVKEATNAWGVTIQMARRYCQKGMVPKVKQENGGWRIPKGTPRPGTQKPEEEKPKQPSLVNQIKYQCKKNNHFGIYEYIQVNLAYSSSRMASNRLTRNQVESIFRKGKVRESFEPMKVSDLIEVLNHCVCVDYILDNLEKPLSVKFIKTLHQMLMYGTVDDRRNKVSPGEFRNSYSNRKETFIASANTINEKVIKLIEAYESLEKVTERDVLSFHVHLGRIFPFEDGNGRVGRLIMLKECLRHGVMPFILDDKRRTKYLQGLREWDKNPDVLISVIAEAQDRFKHQIELQNLGEYRETLFNQIEEDSEDAEW